MGRNIFMSLSYSKLIQDLKDASICDTPYQWFGFTLGLVARGVDPGARDFLSLCSMILNDNEPLPGNTVAALTNIALDCQRNLKNKSSQETLLVFPDSKVSKNERLKVLSDLAYGLSLGLSADGQNGILHKIEDPDLLDGLHTLSAISDVDPNEDLAEDDLSEVLTYIYNLVLNSYKKSHS